LADVLTNASARVDLQLKYGRAELDLKQTGILPSDAKIILGVTPHSESEEMPWNILGDIPDHTEGDRLYTIFHLMGTRGLRRGEAVGQDWH
jgi:hypothetical protein